MDRQEVAKIIGELPFIDQAAYVIGLIAIGVLLVTLIFATIGYIYHGVSKLPIKKGKGK